MPDNDELKHLQQQAVDTNKLAQGKIEFMAQHGVINPFAIIQDRVEWLVEWMIPSHVDEDSGERVRGVKGVPTNPTRLLFDIYCNERTIEKCDEEMGQTTSGLHVVKGGNVDDN